MRVDVRILVNIGFSEQNLIFWKGPSRVKIFRKGSVISAFKRGQGKQICFRLSIMCNVILFVGFWLAYISRCFYVYLRAAQCCFLGGCLCRQSRSTCRFVKTWICKTKKSQKAENSYKGTTLYHYYGRNSCSPHWSTLALSPPLEIHIILCCCYWPGIWENMFAVFEVSLSTCSQRKLPVN